MSVRFTGFRLFLLSAAVIPAPLLAQSGTQPGDASEAAEDSGEIGAESIIVTGRAQKLYRVETTTASKLPTEPLLSSQNITVITSDLIQDQGARDAQDIYRNISGVSFFSYAGVTARGFRQEEIFFDGLRGDPYAGFSVPQLFNLERVEFLKGPAGMLYGPGAPGGLFNYVTKKPQLNGFSADVRGIVGNADRFGGSAEVNAPLGGDFAARGGLFYEDRGLFRFNAASRTFIADGGVSYDPGPFKLILQATRYDQELDANRLRGVPTDDEGNFLASRRWNHNEPGDFLNLRSDVLQGRVEAEPLPGVTFDATLRYNNAVEEQQYHEPRGLFDSDGDGVRDASVREFRGQRREQENWSFGTNLVWSTDIGDLGNRMLVGGDYFDGSLDFDSRLIRGRAAPTPGLPGPLSLLDPVYGVSDPATYNLPAFQNRLTEGYRWGVYLLDELTIDRLILTGGLRFDRFSDTITGGAFGIVQEDSFADEDVTWRVGAVYRVTDEVSAFAQYSTSFEPQGIGSQDPRAGGPFSPTTGDMFEGGIKTALMDGRVQSSLSAYQIRRRNILQVDPRGDVGNDGVDDFVAFGEVTSKGIEFDIAADITPDWVLTMAYAYNDTTITGDNGGGGIGNRVGDRFANAPEHQLGFWTRYQIPDLGLAAAFGGDYVSEQVSLSDQRVQPFMIFDASLIYEVGPVRTMLRVDNLFDKTYAVSGFIDRTGHFPGEPRSIFLEVGYAF
ncbi:TonB-dependent siderophore receptor [Erythrobacter sp.]|uniref:TonB-dependent siderophore receptor n=1 Tax=Erythrobacter sp. TaxID=1042 RepID=UPI0025D8FDAC|nr:TonB-dependent siderophore receptor [Erythrobacter sp.]